MKVFISSTCYDLMDLRADLLQDLRELGVDVLLSDRKDSDFIVSSAIDVNSIEACLVNLRGSDVVIVILSQRYGPNLGATFGNVSATHAEYNEALKLGKPIYFYVRDRLDADLSTWKRNGKQTSFRGAWCGDEGCKGLFALIEAHRKLVDDKGTASRNNWYSTFLDSVDLRVDVRRKLAPRAFRATAEQLIRAGQMPILLVLGQGLDTIQAHSAHSGHYRFRFTLLNAGTSPALDVTAAIDFGGGNVGQDDGVRISAVPTGDDVNTRNARSIQMDIPIQLVTSAFGATQNPGQSHPAILRLRYFTPSGYVLEDRCQIELIQRTDALQYAKAPRYLGKDIIELRSLIVEPPPA